MVPKFSAPLHEAGDALRAGNRELAWQKLQPAMSYPTGIEMSHAEFAQSLGMLELIVKDALADETHVALRAARTDPTDIQSLFDAGHQLISAKLPAVAATALGRANALAANIPALVNELAASLERCGLHFDAFLALQAAYGARQANWTSRYLYTFNALVCGHIVEARQGFSELGEATDETTQVMYDRLTTFFERYATTATVSLLNEHDLRGWHRVITGAMLTHLSPHGVDAGMNGRYAMSQDSAELIHEGVVRAVAVLKAWQLRPHQLVYSNDRSSEILALVWHKRLGIPIKAFTPEYTVAPGLFLAYDLQHADETFRQALDRYRPGQVLVSHASCWNQYLPYTSDISTFLYQTNNTPWDTGRLRVSAESLDIELSEADQTAAPELAQQIVATTLSTNALADLEDLTTLARVSGPPATTGLRDRFVFGSPVRSNCLSA